MECPRIIELPQYLDPRGNLAVIEQCRQVPFRIERCHWIYDVPGGGEREGHAYHKNCEFVVALSGSFDVIVNSHGVEKTFTLNRSYFGLYLPAGVWREFTNFSTNAVAMVLSSTPYSEEDYILDFDAYLEEYSADSTTNSKASCHCSDNECKEEDAACDAEEKSNSTKSENSLLPDFSVDDCSLIRLERHESERLGNLSVVQSDVTVPFPLKRVFHIYDVPGGESRGGHAHRGIREFIVAVAGSFSVTLSDGATKRTVYLNRPYMGLLVQPGVWLTLDDFSSGAVALVLTSDHFSHSDHIKDYNEYIKLLPKRHDPLS